MLEEVPADDLLSDFGSSVSTRAASGLGIVDRQSEMYLNDRLVLVDTSVIVRTSLFGSLQHGASIKVDGVEYRLVHEPIRIADGTYSVLILDQLPP